MLKPILVLVLSMCSIQFGASVAKRLFPIAGVAGTVSLRLLFASLILAFVFRPWRKKFTKAMLKSFFFYGTALGVMNLTFYFALQRIPLGIAVAVEFTGPLAVAVFSSQRKVDYLWVVLAAFGIFLLVPLKETTHSLDPIGIFLALCAGFCWAMYILFGKRAGGGNHGGIAVTMGMCFAALVVVPWGVGLNASQMFQAKAIPLGLVVAFFASAFPYALEMFALKRMPAQTFSVLMSLEPAVASLMGLAVLGEVLTFKQFIAILCVMVSSLGSSMTSAKN